MCSASRIATGSSPHDLSVVQYPEAPSWGFVFCRLGQMPAEPRHLLERLLGPEGVGRDPGGLARAFPDTAESLAEDLALVARERWRVRVEGRFSCLAADAPGDLAISTKALDEILRVDLVKGTVTLGAGTSFEVLARRLRTEGLWLPCDPPGRPDRSVGSLLATGTAG